MRSLSLSLVIVLFLALFAVSQSDAADRPYGLDKRALWTTSNVRGTPDPPPPYRTERAFPNLKFNEPLDAARAPGTGRLFVVERYGKIYSFADDPSVEKADLFLDTGKVNYGLAFHPDFTENGYFYVCYVLDPLITPMGSRVSRFRVRGDTPWVADLASEKVLIEWPSGGHNGGCMQFGPDGYLYIVTGDASEIADGLQTGQDITDLAASVLRVDVDRMDEGLAYGVPADNPFVSTPDARPEVWAYGLRQLWKMSFDRATGALWGGHVGQDLWEQIYIIERGGNYGWSVTEGSYPFRPERPRGPTPIEKPIAEHNHTEARSITGGYVYHGSRLPALTGAYIYGDYDTGKIWSLHYDGEEVTEHQELVDSSLRLVGFLEDDAGELYLVDHMGGGLHRLAESDRTNDGSEFPRKLSDTGLFSSVKDHTVVSGVIPYSVTAPSWKDGAHMERFMALPGDSQIEFEAILYPAPAPGAPPGWKFPDGTVLVQTISLDMEEGVPASRRRIETRLLHHERLAGTEQVGDQYWQGYTYIWNEEQTEATLLESTDGMDKTFTVLDSNAPGGKRQQTWHFPSRAECTVCHNMAAKYALGATTHQMNRDHDYGGGRVDNQLRTFEHIGLFTEPLPSPLSKLPRLVSPLDESADIGSRARSYLHANCSHCHRKWGGGNAEFQLLYTVDLEEAGIVGTHPGQGTFHVVDAEVLAPGDSSRSVMYYRMATIGGGRMPRLGSGRADISGLRLIREWINQLPAASGGSDRALRTATTKSETRTAMNRLRRFKTTEARAKEIDRLLMTTSGSLGLVSALDDGALASATVQEVVELGSQSPEPHIRDLFERFLPEEKRTQRLGSVVDPAQILALKGDASRGKDLFLNAAGVQCKSCHLIQNQGVDVGPDLSQIGKKYDRARLLQTILEPSREIEPKYLVHLVQTQDGEIHTGLLVKREGGQVVLKDAKNTLVTLSEADVALLLPQQKSMMPELLLRDMTAAQVADLIEYLSSLK